MSNKSKILNLYSSSIISPLLFALCIPLSVFILKYISPWMLAGVLDLGAGILLYVLKKTIVQNITKLVVNDSNSLFGDIYFYFATLTGGIVAPVLFFIGLQHNPINSSALLALEAPFTIFLAITINNERISKIQIIGAILLTLSSVAISKNEGILSISSILVVSSTFLYALSHIFTSKIQTNDILKIGTSKLLLSGITNILICLCIFHDKLPEIKLLTLILIAGLICNGISYILYLSGIRKIGAGLGGALYSLIPVFGIMYLIIFFRYQITMDILFSLSFMLLGIVVLLISSAYNNHNSS